MQIAIDVPDYDNGMHMLWEPYADIAVFVVDETVRIHANRPGLVSLARLFLTLADARVPEHNHWHLDPPPVGNLVPGSASAIFQVEDSPDPTYW